jgi:lipoprotein-releasing system permease protein
MKRLAWFIAKREREENKSSQNIMVHIATAAVAVSIAVIVITLAIIYGFKAEISSLISGFAADVTISNPYGKRQPENYPILDSKALQEIISSDRNICQAERYALRNAIIRGGSGASGIVLKGVGNDADISLFAKRVVSGALPQLEGARRKEILLSQSLASQIGASTDSRIEIVIMEDSTPRREVFKVCGVYNPIFGEEGGALALTDIRNVQKLNNWSAEQISGYACRLYDSALAAPCADVTNMRLANEYEGDEDIAAISADEEYATIFGWLETHDINATVILSIMLIVAIFNIITALLILVLERTQMVGTLKSLGMPNKTIRRIFTHHTAHITLRGVVAGDIIAISLLLIQKQFHLIKLDESGYFLPEIPVSIDAGWVVVTNIVFISIIIAVTHLATSIVGRIKVADAIRYS